MQMLRRDLFPLLRVVKSPLVKEAFIEEVANVLQINKEIIRAETESVFKEIEIPKRVEKKVVNINDIGKSKKIINFI